MMLEMNIIQLFETFETNLQAVEYLERVSLGMDFQLIRHYCESKRTSIHKSKDRGSGAGSAMSATGPFP